MPVDDSEPGLACPDEMGVCIYLGPHWFGRGRGPAGRSISSRVAGSFNQLKQALTCGFMPDRRGDPDAWHRSVRAVSVHFLTHP